LAALSLAKSRWLPLVIVSLFGNRGLGGNFKQRKVEIKSLELLVYSMHREINRGEQKGTPIANIMNLI
jgi:hypothetical protein